jgi:drug/metabolite transporter (DMT)-like permease
VRRRLHAHGALLSKLPCAATVRAPLCACLGRLARCVPVPGGCVVVQVVVKSCKLLPTMALGGLLLGKRYSKHEQLAAVLLCAGLVGFTLAEKSGKAAGRPSSPIGVGVLLFAVSCDAVHVLLAERMLKAR